jgi:hypothetical protein
MVIEAGSTVNSGSATELALGGSGLALRMATCRDRSFVGSKREGERSCIRCISSSRSQKSSLNSARLASVIGMSPSLETWITGVDGGTSPCSLTLGPKSSSGLASVRGKCGGCRAYHSARLLVSAEEGGREEVDMM